MKPLPLYSLSPRTLLSRTLPGALLGIFVILLTACDKAAPPAAPAQRPPPEVGVVIAHAESVPLTRELVGRLAVG